MNSKNYFSKRRLKLADMLPGIPVLLVSGADRYRNYPASTLPFRSFSHYLFFGGPDLSDHVLLIINGDATLYRPLKDPDDPIWHGITASDEEIKRQFDFKEVKTFDELTDDINALGKNEVLSLPTPDLATNEFLKSYLGRIPCLDEAPDVDLVEAMIELRRCQDEAAVEQVKAAAQATMELQRSVLGAAGVDITERELRGVLDHKLASNGWRPSFSPIISVAGEVLHNPYYPNTLQAGDLLLVDCGAEVESGYAGDITRTVPVSGEFTETQRALYNIVDDARGKAVAMIKPGVHFADLHKAASLVIAEGLVGLGILKGEPQALVAEGVHALFFCHGLGHLVGLDVHDMEDFGDRIGYGEGEQRSEQFGLSYLRLSRELEPAMVVTIEPGFYNIPALLDGEMGKKFAQYLDREVLSRYQDVRGIRIEDMILVTEDGYENLTAALPTAAAEVEMLVGS